MILKSLKQTIFLLGRRTVYGFLAWLDRLLGRFNPVVILCYHALAVDEWRYSNNPKDFIEQITELKRSGYRFISLVELEAYLDQGMDLTEKVAIINFDDGYKDILSLRDFIREEQLKPTVFILADSAHASQSQITSVREFLSWEDIRSLLEDGWTIGSHTATHASVVDQDADGLRREIIDSRLLIERELGSSVAYFAYPKGAYTLAALEAVKEAGYRLALSMDDGILSRGSNRLTLPRVGVDRTHTLNDFRTLYSPSVVWARGVVKRLLGWSGVQPSVMNRS